MICRHGKTVNFIENGKIMGNIGLISAKGFPGGSVVKNPPAKSGDVGLISGLGRSPGKGSGNPL